MRRWGYILGYLANRLTQIPPMPLSDLAIRRAKPSDRPQKLSDGGGLYLMVAVNGGRYWRW
ncbi:Arm DNA-binding domain-containing protein, partial [Xanthomonas vasicola]